MASDPHEIVEASLTEDELDRRETGEVIKENEREDAIPQAKEEQHEKDIPTESEKTQSFKKGVVKVDLKGNKKIETGMDSELYISTTVDTVITFNIAQEQHIYIYI